MRRRGCCLLVCVADPFCCEQWDEECAVNANAQCVGLCGAAASSCTASDNGSPACDNACCRPSAAVDPFCCDKAWDANCTFIGVFKRLASRWPVRPVATPTPAPATRRTGHVVRRRDLLRTRVRATTELLLDRWDKLCVTLANTLCSSDGCEIESVADDVEEAEGCGADSNDPCDGGTAQSIDLETRVVGRFAADADQDGYLLDLAALDVDGDGFVRLWIELSAVSARLRVLESGCDSAAALTLEGTGCATTSLVGCVPAAGGLLLLDSIGPVDDCDQPTYAFTIRAQDYCGEPCENPGACLEPHVGPGCADASCCDATCTDPTCCVGVDAACATRPRRSVAARRRTTISAETPRSRRSGSPPPTDALHDRRIADRMRLRSRGGDVWFSHVVECDGLTVFSTATAATSTTRSRSIAATAGTGASRL